MLKEVGKLRKSWIWLFSQLFLPQSNGLIDCSAINETDIQREETKIKIGRELSFYEARQLDCPKISKNKTRVEAADE